MKTNRGPEAKAGKQRQAHAVAAMPMHPAIAYGAIPLLVAAAAVFLAAHPITDPDFWYHAAFGRTAMLDGRLPRADIFSHTAAGHYWISSGWLPDLLLHALYSTFGPTGPVAFVCAIIGMTALTTYLVSQARWNGNWMAGIAILAGLLMAYPRYNPRPDILSLLLTACLCLLLTSTEDTAIRKPASAPRRLWLVPLLIALWANLHALFFIGAFIAACYGAWRVLLWRRTRDAAHLRAATPCAVGLVAWLANPYGWRLLQFVYDNATLPDVGKRVFELKPLFGGGPLPAHIVASVVVFFGIAASVAWACRRSISPWRWIALALFSALAFYQRRQIGLAAFAVPALLAPELGELQSRLARWRIPGMIALFAVAGGVGGLRVGGVLEMSPGRPRAGVDCRWFPCSAARFLRENPPPQNLFHDLYIGGYLLHELGPDTKVFIDGRLEIYKGAPWNDYFGPADGKMRPAELFAKYGVKTCVMDIRDPKSIATQLAMQPDWKLVYFDDEYAVLTHEEPATADYVADKAYRYVNPLDPKRLMAANESPEAKATALREAERAVQQAPESTRARSALQYLSGQ